MTMRKMQKKRYNQRAFFVLTCFIFPLGFFFSSLHRIKWCICECVCSHRFNCVSSFFYRIEYSFVAARVTHTQLNPKRVEHKCLKSGTTMMNCLLMVLHFLGSTNVVCLCVFLDTCSQMSLERTQVYGYDHDCCQHAYSTPKNTTKKKK